MTDFATLDDMLRLYAARGGLHYGEGITQIEHAVQCAALAEAEGAAPALIVAALFHDVGHLLAGEDDIAPIGMDDRHEIAGADLLATLFGADVAGPVSLHVAAKRYLCFSEPGYFAALSSASQRSLGLQGGPFDAAGAADFERRPYWREAVALRRFDDTGKQAAPSPRRFDDLVPLARGVLRANIAP